ncbi:hypothetical protein [Ammoniphilus resinae]|uniref:Uncharacterized protein n=1 Tax=Ammoniphilus resinae TaxID=861532 RepID=A0ABS4GXV4_9BACL|nr:hypothetical protein [Ammoniphilus resinae]MBP1935098.1 hypothetical protein [Ammoniphilus resinae]
MFFLNKDTGLIWEVVDADSIKRCQNDSNYEEVEKPRVEQEEASKSAKKPAKK